MVVLAHGTVKANENVAKEKGSRYFQRELLEKARDEMGISQAELDKMCGFSKGTIQRYEAGFTQPGADALFKLSDVMGISVDYLLGLTKNPESTALERQLTDSEQALLALYRNDLRWEVIMRIAQEALEREKLKNIPRKTDE